MAKKSFTTGLDNLLTPTLPVANKPTAKQTRKSVIARPPTASGELAQMMILIPVELKIKLDTYCAQNRISKKDFIISLIAERI
jgi:hypothetical protein